VLMGSYCIFIATVREEKIIPGHVEICFMYTCTCWVLNCSLAGKEAKKAAIS
jgi:hypothetical protein